MGDKKFKVSTQYDQMNNGPHERPFVPIGAPCLAYHVAFWHRDVIDKKDEVKCLPDSFDEGIECSTKEDKHKKSNTDLVGEYFDRVRSFFSENNKGFVETTKTSPDLIKERTRTWTTSFSANGAEELTLIAENHTEYWRFSVILNFKEHQAKVCLNAQRIFKLVLELRDSQKVKTDISEMRSALVEEFEVFVRDNVLPPVPVDAEYSELTNRCFCNLIGSVFWKPTSPGRWPHHDVNGDKVWDEPVFNKPRLLVKKLWPMIERLQGEPSATPGHRDYEMAASLMLDGRAIYASSLGHPATEMAMLTEKVPVVYSLIVCFDDAWQLGRLIDTVHSIETLRLAALRDIEKIGVAAQKLFSIRAFLREGGDVEDVQEKMDELLRSDVSWRVERSQRYWKQFKYRVDRLRIGRIEGFQPYDDFVFRRIGDTITFIESVGRQLSLIRKEIDLRYQLKQTKILQRQTISMKETGRQILVLQKVGEGLLLIPFTYYCYMLCEKLLKKTSIDIDHIKIYFSEYLLFGLALFFSASAMRLADWLKEKETERHKLAEEKSEAGDRPGRG